jgi:hypothetical protein
MKDYCLRFTLNRLKKLLNKNDLSLHKRVCDDCTDFMDKISAGITLLSHQKRMELCDILNKKDEYFKVERENLRHRCLGTESLEEIERLQDEYYERFKSFNDHKYLLLMMLSNETEEEINKSAREVRLIFIESWLNAKKDEKEKKVVKVVAKTTKVVKLFESRQLELI